jgi:hypothetical protein
MRKRLFARIKCVFLSLSLIFANGCSYFISSTTEDFGRNLKQAILNQNDPQTVAEAMPAYLLMQEALLASDPDDEALLMSTANLYASYIALSVHLEPLRGQRLSQKAFDLALRGACLHKTAFCALNDKTFADFETIIKQSDTDDLDSLYVLGTSWANWIQLHQSDWYAIAQLAQVKLIMNHVIAMDESYKNGEAYLYLGVLESIVPPALGGKPDVAKRYFEKALVLSDHKNLMVHVLYARHYARMMFDRNLHDTLLTTVINTKVQHKGLTLGNVLAQQQAKELLQSADEYF